MEKTLGIILAGGYGTRLLPLTKVINKHLLPIYNKPLIYYSLTILLKANIKNILLVTNPENVELFKKQLFFLKNEKINIKFIKQNKPYGIAHALKINRKEIKNKDVLLVLGDNIIKSEKIFIDLKKNHKNKSIIFTKKVEDPNRFGVLTYKNKVPFRIIEKPRRLISNEVVAGIYFYKNKHLNFLDNLKKSKRGEYEITDLNNKILDQKNLFISKLKKNDYWLDTGNIEGITKAINYFSKNKDNFFNIIWLNRGL